jgi:rRNA processing protein Gar1
MVHKSRLFRAGSKSTKGKSPRVTESAFRTKLLKKLRDIPDSYFFVKEAKNIRGIADIIGCISGVFVAIEVKRSLQESLIYSERNALQDKFLKDIAKAGGMSYKVYPENMEEILEKLYQVQ